MAKYKSKIGIELLLPLAIIMGGAALIMMYNHLYTGLIIILLATGFIAYIFASTVYTIENGILKISSGILFGRVININSIKSIKETNNPISAPANSLDRLLITYNKYDSVIISPKEKQAFIDHLVNMQPNISVYLKETNTKK